MAIGQLTKEKSCLKVMGYLDFFSLEVEKFQGDSVKNESSRATQLKVKRLQYHFRVKNIWTGIILTFKLLNPPPPLQPV